MSDPKIIDREFTATDLRDSFAPARRCIHRAEHLAVTFSGRAEWGIVPIEHLVAFAEFEDQVLGIEANARKAEAKAEGREPISADELRSRLGLSS